MNLPAAPLLAVFERAAVSAGYLGNRHKGERYPGLEAFAVSIGMHARFFYRIRDEGTVSVWMADRVAVALGLLPILIWPAEYTEWLQLADYSECCPEGHVLDGPICPRCRSLEAKGRKRERYPGRTDLPPCRRCGATERYADGQCRPCKKADMIVYNRRRKERAA